MKVGRKSIDNMKLHEYEFVSPSKHDAKKRNINFIKSSTRMKGKTNYKLSSNKVKWKVSHSPVNFQRKAKRPTIRNSNVCALKLWTDNSLTGKNTLANGKWQIGKQASNNHRGVRNVGILDPSLCTTNFDSGLYFWPNLGAD